jgi:hypothetical protein
MLSPSRCPLVWSDTAPRKAYRPRSEGICRLYTPPFKDNRRCIQVQIDEDARVDLCGQPVRDVGGRHQEGRVEGVRLPFERDVARLEVPVQHQVRQLMHRVEPGSVPMALVGTEHDDRAVPVRDLSYGTASELRPASAARARQKASARCHSSAVACSSY